MRQGGSNNRRPRNRHHNGGQNGGGNGGGNVSVPGPSGQPRVRSAASLRHQTFDSNGPDVRVRGNAWQVHEKYQALARDAFSSGDRVLAENYQQHAEHYYRIIEAINEATAQEQRGRGGPLQPMNAQPDMPPNAFGPDAGRPQAAQPVAPVQQPTPAGFGPQPVVQPMQGNAMPPAEVERRTPPPSALFTQEEISEHMSHDPLRRLGS